MITPLFFGILGRSRENKRTMNYREKVNVANIVLKVVPMCLTPLIHIHSKSSVGFFFLMKDRVVKLLLHFMLWSRLVPALACVIAAIKSRSLTGRSTFLSPRLNTIFKALTLETPSLSARQTPPDGKRLPHDVCSLLIPPCCGCCYGNDTVSGRAR